MISLEEVIDIAVIVKQEGKWIEEKSEDTPKIPENNN